jgi:hypothetical protein
MPMPHRRPLVLLRRALPLLLIGACKGDGSGPNDYTPLVCGQGNGESAQVAIDGLGGTVTVRGHTLTVPAGAVSARTEFSITEAQAGHIGVEVQPHGTKFNSNATLVLSYARCGGNPSGYSGLRVVEVTSGTTKVIRGMPSQVDSATRTVRTTGLDHLSGYLIAGT